MSFIEESTAKLTDREVRLRDTMNLLSAEKDRSFYVSNQVLLSPDKKMFMRGDAVNKHLSVGFRDLTRI